MTRKKTYLLLLIAFVTSLGFLNLTEKNDGQKDKFVSYIVNPKKQKIEFFWKNEKGENYKNAKNLIFWLATKNRQLIFSTNGGMYRRDASPQGLYIENGIKKSEIDTANGSGNFYLKPNGVFYLTTNNEPKICDTRKFQDNGTVKFATQSGPLLLLNGSIHDAFNKESVNVNIRNGVGILPNNELLFAMSKNEMNFYEFATYFKKKGCKNALYLDGFVSRTYLPEKKWEQLDGNFGVIIGVTK